MNKKKFETKAIRTRIEKTQHREHCTPIFATSSFLFDSAEHARAVFAEEKEGNIYSRFSNPNTDEFILKMCLLEGAGEGIATSSGMAAIFLSFISFLRAGDHVVASRSLFGATISILTDILPRFGISHTLVDIDADISEWEDAIMPQTRIIFIETPSNPGLDIIEIKPLANLANENNALLVVDNSFATPYVQRPIEHGAHIVCHSATKFIDGQGRNLGGIILGDKLAMQEVRSVAQTTGPIMSPMDAWMLSKSLETLHVRMERHCSNAQQLAEYLATSDQIELVKYPFLKNHAQVEIARKQMNFGGAMVSFEAKGGIERNMKFVDSLEMFSVSSNLGDTRTIITHAASTTLAKLSSEEQLAVGVTQGLLRISVGLEHIDDIIADVEQALAKSK